MDFSSIRPKLPVMKPEPPPPPSSGPPPAAPEEPPPRWPQEMAYPYGYEPPRMGQYMEELDRASHMHRLRSIEYKNTRTWKVNFGGYHDDYYYNNHYNYSPSGHQPSGYMVAQPHSHDHMLPAPPPQLGLPTSDHYHGLPGPPPRLDLPPPDHHHALPVPPPRLALPPPEYHHGPPPYYHSQPHYSYFSDENPNGCKVM